MRATRNANAAEQGPERADRAFTLIEVLVVVIVIGILAAVVVPKFVSAQGESAVAATAEDLKSIETAIGMYNAKSGVWPTEVAQGVTPPGVGSYFKGPIPLAKPCPIGGVYDYDAPAAGQPAQISIRAVAGNAFTAGNAQALDAHFDDGDTSAGTVRVPSPTQITYRLSAN